MPAARFGWEAALPGDGIGPTCFWRVCGRARTCSPADGRQGSRGGRCRGIHRRGGRREDPAESVRQRRARSQRAKSPAGRRVGRKGSVRVRAPNLPAPVCVCACVTHTCVCVLVCTHGNVCVSACVCVCVCVCVCDNCVHVCVCVSARLCVCVFALRGGALPTRSAARSAAGPRVRARALGSGDSRRGLPPSPPTRRATSEQPRQDSVGKPDIFPDAPRLAAS